MCSSTVADPANMSRQGSTLCSPAVEKILCRSPFRSGHMSASCARLSQKEVGVKRVETLVSTLLPRRGARRIPALRRAQLPAESQRKTLRPLGANTLTQFARPGQPVQEKRAAPLGANTLTQFAHPGFPVQEKGEDAKSNGETAANFVYCYKIAQNRSVLLEMTGAKC